MGRIVVLWDLPGLPQAPHGPTTQDHDKTPWRCDIGFAVPLISTGPHRFALTSPGEAAGELAFPVGLAEEVVYLSAELLSG